MSWLGRAWRTFSGWPRWAQILTGIVIVVVIGAAASGGKKNPSATTTNTHALGSTSPNATITDTAGGQGSSGSGGSRRVTKADYGSSWPLTVSEGTLGCQKPPYPGAVTFTTNDETVYWINGTAGNAAPENGWKDVKPIWAKPKHPLFPSQRKDIGVLIDDGLNLCGS